MDHVGVVVSDLEAAKEFFALIGLEAGGTGSVSGEWVDRIVALEGVEVDVAFVQTPDGHGRLELICFRSPEVRDVDPGAPANTLGIRHLAFAVEDIDAVVSALRASGAELMGEVVRYEDSYRLCYVRGPEGIIVELAQPLRAPPTRGRLRSRAVAMLTVYEKPTCSTCRKLRALLDERGVEYESIDYHATGLREPELRDLLSKAGCGPREVLRTREPLVAELGLEAPERSDEELITQMVRHPELLQRPMAVRGDRALMARPIERVLELL
jgi:arsenate reductase (glutaredoxin)